MDTNDFYKKMIVVAERFLNGKVEKTEEKMTFSFGKDNQVIYEESISDIDKLLGKVSTYKNNTGALYSDVTYEIPIYKNVERLCSFESYETISSKDCDNGIEYIISPASYEYTLFFLETLNKNQIRRINDYNKGLPEESYIFGTQEGTPGSLFYFLQCSLRDLKTLKICTINQCDEKKFAELADSFRFQIAINHNTLIKPIRDLQEFCMDEKKVASKGPISNVTAPKKIYISAITNQYYRGITSNLSFVEFISHYHVMEYFFEKIYNDEIVKGVQEKLSDPRFSLKQEPDINALIKYVSQKVRYKNEHYEINEKEALELVLQKYIVVQDIVAKLTADDIDYYKTTVVPFSEGDIVDLNDTTNPKIYKKLASRIYKTRNSIVHSKFGEKAFYSPFDDDAVLDREIPLMRCIAEEIIIKTAKIL